MNRLTGLTLRTLRTLRNRTPNALSFTFTIEIDRGELGEGAFSQQLLQAVEKIEMSEFEGWKKCEDYLLKCISSGELIELGEKKYKIIEVKEEENGNKSPTE